jgi:hypothetical protein
MEPSLTLEHKNEWVGSSSSTFSPPFSPSSASDDYPTKRKISRSLFFDNNWPFWSAKNNIPSNPAILFVKFDKRGVEISGAKKMIFYAYECVIAFTPFLIIWATT